MHYILIQGKSQEACDAVRGKLDRYFEEREEIAVIRTAVTEEQLEDFLKNKAPDIAFIWLGEETLERGEDCGDSAAAAESAADAAADSVADTAAESSADTAADSSADEAADSSADTVAGSSADAAADSSTDAAAVKIRDLSEFRSFMEKQLRSSPEAGLRAAQRIRELSRSTVIIFLSKTNSYAEEAYFLGAISFLREPLSLIKIRAVMNSALWRVNSSASLVIRSDEGRRKVYAADIRYVEAELRKIVIHLQSEEVRGYGTLKGVLDDLPAGEFLKISRYCAVAAACIARIGSKEIILKDGTSLPVSARMLHGAVDGYEAWMRRTAMLKE